MSYPQYKNGDEIVLYWEDWREAYYVRGHVSEETFRKAIKSNNDDVEEIHPPKHKYGRWSMEPREDGNGLVLRVYDAPGRGRFPITEAMVK